MLTLLMKNGPENRFLKELLDIPDLNGEIREIENTLGQFGRVLIRYSGTEPLLRIMVEGEDETKLHRYAQDLAELVNKHLSVPPLLTPQTDEE